MKYMSIGLIICLGLIVLIVGCGEEKKDNLKPNILPETSVFLHLADPVNEMPDTTISRQSIFWYGNDPDGRVVGYYYHWDYFGDAGNLANWVWTTAENRTFYVPLQEEFGTFTFQVKAVDNTAQFNGAPAENNPPLNIEGAIDLTPAMLKLPVKNSPPLMDFVLNSNPQDNVADTTFSTRTFFWTANDPDGDETITNFLWSLDDTTDWNTLPGNQRNLTLTNIPEGLHTFYIKATDIASAYSPVLIYPDTASVAVDGWWYVKSPHGSILLVNDEEQPAGLEFYYTVLVNANLGSDFSIWTVKDRLPYYQEDIRATLEFFDTVIWFADRTPNVPEASQALNYYWQSGKNLVFSSPQCFDEGDTLFAFLPVDSLLAVDIQRILPDTEIRSLIPEYPTLYNNVLISYADAPVPAYGAETIYLLTANPPWHGELPFGIRAPAGGPAKLIYFPARLHQCNRDNSAEQFLQIVLHNDFGYQ